MDFRSSKINNFIYYLSIVLISCLYFFLRLGFTQTIEFGYDQPLLATQVIEFLKNPSFINSYNFVASNPWGFPSWGPAQIFFWVPFLLISKNPILISQLAAVFNLLGIIFIFLIGQKFFSRKVAIIASLILVVHPWSVVFSRMIYQPTPVITLTAISMFLNFYILDNPKTKLLIFLIPLWAFMFQIYIHTAVFIFISALILIINFKKISKTNLLIGALIASFMFLPVFYFFKNNPSEINGILRVSSKFDQLRNETPYGFNNIVYEFLGVTGGARFNWQLGYGYQNFVIQFPETLTLEKIGFYIVVLLIFYHLIRLILDRRLFSSTLLIKRLLLLLWFISPIIFLTLIKTPIALPRFFLLSLPPLSLLIGIFVDDLTKRYKFSIVYLFLVLLLIFWFKFILNYYNFVINYNYKNGFLSNFSDVPYSFLDKTFTWIKNDSQAKGYKSYIVEPVNQASVYYINHILNSENKNEEGKKGSYKIIFSSQGNKIEGDYAQLGPYVVFEVKN